MSEINSELIANIATSAINSYFTRNENSDVYIKKSEWDDYDIKYENDNPSNYSTDIYDDYEIYNSDIIYPLGSNLIYNIEYDNILISDLKIKIKLNNLEFSAENINKLLDINLCFRAGLSVINNLSMELNLLLAHILGKHQKEYDDFLEIPIIFLDLERNKFGNKYPLFLVKYLLTNIDVSNINDIANSGVIFSYRKYKTHNIDTYINTNIDTNIDSYKDCSGVSVQIQNTNYIFKNVDSKYNLNFNLICKIIIVKLIGHESFEDQISKIKLTLAGSQPIVWDYDQIMTYTIFGNTYYCVPLSPDIKSKKRLKKILLNKERGHGINFSGIDKIEISFEFFSRDFSCEIIGLSCLNLNISKYTCGMTGVLFVT